MAKAVLVKFLRDTEPLMKAGFADTDVIPWTNRRQESLFAHAKALMRRFPTMTVDKPLDLAISKINQLEKWLMEMVC